MKYTPINDKGDFIESDCLFEVDGLLYCYSGVIHDTETVFGIKLCTDRAEYSFKFDQVETIYKPYKPQVQP